MARQLTDGELDATRTAGRDYEETAESICRQARRLLRRRHLSHAEAQQLAELHAQRQELLHGQPDQDPVPESSEDAWA